MRPVRHNVLHHRRGILVCRRGYAFLYLGDGRWRLTHLHDLVAQVNAANGGLALKVLVTNPTDRQRDTWLFEATDIHIHPEQLY
ncbi:hypothetical protein F4820DRAFT_405701 [Hypoxylon rubiginosum]|uniref:Uncharacterized protein n=1 Tax=Hypoxylon rubiginosum TaxID=110542 RepID=A0ACB9ZDY7_9PEZI|nr:hypothetical protein F4820DRAFT_405701 [Hypoxylon rubiginosum]